MIRSLPLLGAVLLSALAFSPALAADPFPARIDLPDGWRPEGIDINGETFYVGSIPTGAVYAGSLRTGEGDIVVPVQEGRAAIGVEYDRGMLFVAGGGTGDGYVYDASTGASLRTYDFASGSDTFINDVVVTRRGAYFTDSRRPVIYFVPSTNGTPGEDFEVISITGDYVHVAGMINLNGIDATPNGKVVIAMQTSTGTLFKIDPETGHAQAISLGGQTLPGGDGILLEGRTLYVVQNRLNQVTKVELSSSFLSGAIVGSVSSPDFDIPTTVASHGNHLYLPNARFGTAGTEPADYWITQVPRP
jgi:sugar lactone lactonase YvrE